MVTASSSPLHFSLLTCSGKGKGIKVWQRDVDSASISVTKLSHGLGEVTPLSVLPSYCLQSGNAGLGFPWGSALKTTGIGFCMRALDEQIFCFTSCNVVILIILLIKKKMKRRKKSKGRSRFTAAFSTEVSALQGLPPAHYSYL